MELDTDEMSRNITGSLYRCLTTLSKSCSASVLWMATLKSVLDNSIPRGPTEAQPASEAAMAHENKAVESGLLFIHVPSK
ncbi:MAG: hypothetical protein EB102_01370 [Gammaproteobacteria bacterium]|nr:hypothetical protein [Gammaproteobacteria bacterium]